MTTEEASATTRRILVSSFLPGVGKGTLWRIASQREFARIESDQDLAEVFPELREFKYSSPAFSAALRQADKQFELAKKLEVNIIGFWDKDYPRTFRKAALAPAIFWYQGDRSALEIPTVGVIGTRQPTRAGKISAERIAKAMAELGLNIVSGLAIGIDTIAHKSALEVKGKTIAVMPGGIDTIAPKSNVELAARILESGGGILTEFPTGFPTYASNFVTRDATQAALSIAIIMVQSDRDGGSMHASRAILRLNRELIVVAPTKIDIQNAEPKIEANLLFVRKSFAELIANLKFPNQVTSLTRILSSKNEYTLFYEEILRHWQALRPTPPRSPQDGHSRQEPSV